MGTTMKAFAQRLTRNLNVEAAKLVLQVSQHMQTKCIAYQHHGAFTCISIA